MRFLCGPFLRQLSSVLTIMFCRRRRRWMVTRGRGSHPAGCARRVLLEERACSRFLRLRNAYDNGRAVKDSGGATEQDGANVEVTSSLSSLLMADAVPGGRVSMDHRPAVPRGLASS